MGLKVELSLNGIDVESFLFVLWLNLALNGIDVESFFVRFMDESGFEQNLC